ncbi:MAG: Sapep family Mn(2+)-dependent dipeptidase, partial [Clostridiales Family XIII bacterium]|nr:Sapep family Mn(2+)-dependent dipeptidase [Clostridiales Family XIII bacterium]
HLDVVPAGGAWVHGPFDADIADGRVYGRGAIDDKGPAAAVYMALKALKDSGFIPTKTIRVIIGLDEETGWSGMYRYLDAAGSPDLGFTPDGSFPAVNGEKGILNFELAKKLGTGGDTGVSIRSISGGNAPNMVPDSAKAIIMDDTDKGFGGVKAKLAEYRASSGRRVTGRGIGKSFEITAQGVSAHGATPCAGENAISALLEFLGTLDIANDSVRAFIDFYNERIGFEVYGEGLGIGFADEPSGKLTLNVGKMAMDRDAAILTLNVRYPVTFTSDAVYDALMPIVHRYDLGVVKGIDQKPIWFEPDDTLIGVLMDVYREQTGDADAAPITIGGGTYARAIPHAVAFGPGFPGGPQVEHQADEYIDIENLMKLTHIYAEAMRKLSTLI